ncbi:MAG: hypothetical protein JWM85_350 [Acidimicrobiaceae bacterium]|nr:hypothetical protein [Acidimicrobiaceae bacterium]
MLSFRRPAPCSLDSLDLGVRRGLDIGGAPSYKFAVLLELFEFDLEHHHDLVGWSFGCRRRLVYEVTQRFNALISPLEQTSGIIRLPRQSLGG